MAHKQAYNSFIISPIIIHYHHACMYVDTYVYACLSDMCIVCIYYLYMYGMSHRGNVIYVQDLDKYKILKEKLWDNYDVIEMHDALLVNGILIGSHNKMKFTISPLNK